MAHYKGAASEAGRAMHLIKKREKQQMEIEIRRKKIEEELKVTNIETKFATHNDDAGQGEVSTYFFQLESTENYLVYENSHYKFTSF